ncbi:hypothetical protein MSSD14B_38550 [Marinobacter salsuginis]|uniref:Uncharacterized protein n=2 Tax=Marinobacter salsuginis TaxID=418719 RepID=A0A5M3Q4V6_9GAMM|nr:hypothetical protein MSSD14B_38550 [Marinobacter salsuginis]
MTSSANLPTNSPEQAWFTGLFSVDMSGTPVAMRLYLYPGAGGSQFPADMRMTSGDGDMAETVFEGLCTIENDELRFYEKSNVDMPGNPPSICTLAARRATEDQFIGGPETHSGLFEPELALKIAQLRKTVNSGNGSKAAALQLNSLVQRGTPVTILIEQNDSKESMLH